MFLTIIKKVSIEFGVKKTKCILLWKKKMRRDWNIWHYNVKIKYHIFKLK